MADHGHHQIVMRHIHRVDLGADAFQQRPQPRQFGRVGLGTRRQQPPAVLEQRGKARPRAGVFGARHRVAGNEMHPRRDMRRHRLDHSALDAAHIGNHGSGLQMRRDLGGNRAHRADRHRQHHQIGTLHGLGRRLADPVAEQLARHRPCLGRSGMADDLGSQPLGAHRMGHRAGDKAKADQRDAGVDHAHPAP